MKKIISIAGIIAAPMIAEAQGTGAPQFNDRRFSG